MYVEPISKYAGGRAAFFDVDETLVSTKSMVAFLQYWLQHWEGDSSAFRQAMAELRAQAESDTPRAELTRMYYRLFIGVPYADLLAAGREWYRQYRGLPDAFIGSALSALTWHQARGDLIVLVSGSFRGCLDPIAADLLADRVVCTEPIVDEAGLLTGEVRLPMVGTNKAIVVAQTIASLQLIPEDCYCYADHSSDLQMLSQVGHPRVVGEDPVLRQYARRHRWPVLSARPVPRQAPTDAIAS